MRAGFKSAIFIVSVMCVRASLLNAQVPMSTNILNFRMPGTQPGGLTDLFASSSNCQSCHGGTVPGVGDPVPIFDDWTGSLMAQAARDPLFYACLDIAEADAPGSGDICIRCHVPKAWLEGRSSPTNGNSINAGDRDGINCSFCHRLVDPFNTLGDAPAADAAILAALAADAPNQSADRGMPSMPGDNGNGNYVIDPFDRRRGPFPLPPIGQPAGPGEADCELYHDAFYSPLHRRSEICSTCHDVSLPHFKYDAMGTSFIPNAMGTAHPTGNKYDMVPIERTYSEWLRSDFAVGIGVDMQGRFGGPGQTYVSTCQDCHMPFDTGYGCKFVSGPRPDLPRHFLSGASTWQLDAIAQQYGPTGLNELNASKVSKLAENKARNIAMLGIAADLETALDDSQTPGTDQLRVRVINQTGHKLPSGYPEGRRIFVTVEFFDCTDSVTPIEIFGHYDTTTAELDAGTTKVYEMHGGLDEALAATLGRTPGPASHFVLTNKIFKDNRIPPRGFTNLKFAAVQANPVAYAYADGQYWDDTYFDIPPYAVGAKVTLSYQATTKEYIEFLRDNNPFPGNPNNRGQVAYNLWLANGKSAPVKMAEIGNPVPFNVELKGDVDGDRQVTVDDIPGFVDVLLGLDADPRHVCAADMNSSLFADGADVQAFTDKIMNP